MRVNNEPPERRARQRWRLQLLGALVLGGVVGVIVAVASKSSPEVVAGAGVGVAVVTLLVQVFTWTDGRDHGGGTPPTPAN